MIRNNFIKRHNGPTASDAEKMLKVIGVNRKNNLSMKSSLLKSVFPSRSISAKA